MSDLQNPPSSLDAETAVLADLNRLLREGLAAVEWVDVDVPPRFHVTPRGRDYLADCVPVEPVRVHVRITDRADARSPAPHHPTGGDREKGSSG